MVAFLFEAGESKGKSATVFGILFLFPDLFFRNHTEWYISTRSSIYPPPPSNGRAQAVRGPAAAVVLLRPRVLRWCSSRPGGPPWGCWRSGDCRRRFIPGCLRPWHPPRAATSGAVAPRCSGRRMLRLGPFCHSRWCWFIAPVVSYRRP